MTDRFNPSSSPSASGFGFHPLVSLIIINHNYGQYLRSALESALHQTYDHTEIIAVDDGSTDSSRDVLQNYADRVLVLLKENCGEISAVNFGFSRSRGDIVLFVDADDVLEPNAAAKIVAGWTPNASKVQYCMNVIDGEGNSRHRTIPPYPREFSPRDVRNLVLKYGIYPSPPTTGNAYSRAYLMQVLPLDDTEISFGPDGALNSIAPLYGDVVTLDHVLSSYRVHDRNASSTGRLDALVMLSEIRAGNQRDKLLRRHASALGIRIPNVHPLDHSMHFLERRLAVLKLLPESNADHAIALFWRACRCIRYYERLRIRMALKLVWFLVTALAPRGMARRLLEYRFVEGELPTLPRLGWNAAERRATTSPPDA